MILRLCHRFQYIRSAAVYSGRGCLIYSMLFMPFHVFAQTVADTLAMATEVSVVSVTDAETRDDGALTVSFRPKDVQVQDRYRPREKDYLFPSQWWRRLFVGAGAGFQGLSDNVGSVSDTYLHLYLGYRFSPVHSLRLHGTYTTFKYGADKKSARSGGLGLDYLANLSNFAWGYNPSRIIDVSTMVGVGARANRTGLPHKIQPYAHIGFHADVHLSSNFSLFAEPYVGMHRGMDGLFGRRNHESWDMMYGVNAGLQMTLDKRNDFFAEADSIYRRFFFDSSIGVVVPGRGSGIMHLTGTGYQASVGMWLNPMLGLRVGGHTQSSRWSSHTTTINGAIVRTSRNQSLFSGRIEMLLNPMNFSRGWRNAKGGHDFDINIALGGDFGWKMKADVPNTTNGSFRCYYYGFTGALQALYRISKPGSYIFVEPRYLAAMYSVPYRNTSNSLLTLEHNLSFNVGTRLYMTGSYHANVGENEFIPHWWGGVDVGGVKWQRTHALTTGGLGINPTVGVSLGYDWKRFASFRVQLAYQRLYDTRTSSYACTDARNRVLRGSGLWNSAYDVMDVRLAYMLNLSNLFQGYDNARRFNLWFTAGPSLSYVMNQSDDWVDGQKHQLPSVQTLKVNGSKAGKASPGVTASLMAALRVAPQYEVTVEALGQYNFLYGINPGDKPRLNNIKYGLALGTRYHFEQDQLYDFFHGTDSRPWQKGWELNASYGWAIPLDTRLGFHGSGCNMSMSVGYWLNSLLGARLGMFGQQSYYRKHDVAAVMEPVSGVQVHAPYSVYYSQLMIGGRAEVMLNPLNLIRSHREGETAPRWDMNLSAGMNFGGMYKSGNFVTGYTGFTGSAAVLYRLSNIVQVYLEPRYDSYNFSRHVDVLNYDAPFSDPVFTLSVGARITRPVGESREERRMTSPEQMSHRGFWVGGNIGGSKMIQILRPSGSGLSLQPYISTFGGYDLSRLSSFRVSLNYDVQSRLLPSQPYEVVSSGVKRRYRGAVDSKFHQMELQALYMLNVTNLWTGCDRRNALNLYLEAGPMFSYIMAQSTSLADGEVMGGTNFRYLGYNYGGKWAAGLAAGAMVAIPVNRNWDITAEVLGQYYLSRSYLPEYSSNLVNGVKINFGVGTRYNF